MKTFSLYLVLLSLSVIGCQKDIDEPSVLSAKNTKNCNCKKVKYLPIKVEQEGRVVYFIYLNDEGDLLAIQSDLNGLLWHFDYSNDILKEVSISDNNPTDDSRLVTIKYTNNLLSEMEFASIHCYEDPYWPVDDPHIACERNTYRKNLFTWTNYKLTTYKKEDELFNLTYENNLLSSIERSPKTNSPGDTKRLNYHTDKNYWAKDIRNKEVLFALNLGFLSILPIEKDLSSSIDSYDRRNGSVDEVITTYVSKYNTDGYPVEIEIKTSTNTYTRKITFKKIILE